MRVDVVGESSFDAGWLSLRHCYVALLGSVCTAAVAKCCAQQIKERAALSWVCRFYPIATAAAIKQSTSSCWNRRARLPHFLRDAVHLEEQVAWSRRGDERKALADAAAALTVRESGSGTTAV
jgi:hypothetical protein